MLRSILEKLWTPNKQQQQQQNRTETILKNSTFIPIGWVGESIERISKGISMETFTEKSFRSLQKNDNYDV